MLNASLGRIVRSYRAKSAFHILATSFFAFFALLPFGSLTAASAQDAKPAPPATAPSAGKALVYIYRVGRFVGSASHDHLYVNGVYLAYLKNSEYAGMEVDPGTVVVTGSTEMYYAGGIATSSYAGIKNGTKKENERIRLDAEAGKTYYMKWTSGTMGTGVKVTLMDAGIGAKEMSKLHLSKPVDDKDTPKPETKDTDKPAAK
jgi:hypothetical protein